MAEAKKILVKQIRSGAGREPKFRGTLEALGLGRIGKSKIHASTPTVLGMIKKVGTVLEVSPTK